MEETQKIMKIAQDLLGVMQTVTDLEQAVPTEKLRELTIELNTEDALCLAVSSIALLDTLIKTKSPKDCAELMERIKSTVEKCQVEVTKKAMH